ncbi:uncharacterized protein [Asterias amurensis]|uniref:uncharacterized protein n=1 Tax=Asterias amurensis TaxID=7602 RepID=UPI003AB2E25C
MSNPKPKSGSSRGLRAWLREYVRRPSADSRRVSHTKVQVLSKTTGDPWSNPSANENFQYSWKRISDIRGKDKSIATRLETTELSQQNGAKKTSDDVPDCSGKSSRNSRSFWQALLGSKGNRRTAKVAPLPINSCEQKGNLMKAPTSSGKLPKESGSLLQISPNNCRENLSTGNSAPTLTGASKSCKSNGNFARERTTQDLILSDLDDETTLKKPQYLHSVVKQPELGQRIRQFEILGNGLLQRKPESGKCEEKKLLSKKHEPAKHFRGQESQIKVRGERRVTVQKEKGSMISLNNGDNKSYTSPGFLLHSKPSRGGATSPSRRGRQVQDVDSIQREPTPYSWTSQSSMYDIWKRTGECEDRTKLADGDSEESVTSSEYIGQEGIVKPSESVGRSHTTMKPKWFTDFNRTNDASKMPKPKTHRGLVANEACGKEDLDFLSHGKCSDKIDAAHGEQAIGLNHPMGDLGVSTETKMKDIDIWRNDFEENQTLVNILEEEEDGEQSSVNSSSMSVYDTWYGGDRCEENTVQVHGGRSSATPHESSHMKAMSEMVDREDSLKPSSEQIRQESITGKPSHIDNKFTENNSENDESKMMARPKTKRGLVVKGGVDKNSPAEELGIVIREICDGHENVGTCGRNEAQSLLLRGQQNELTNVDIWRNNHVEHYEVGGLERNVEKGEDSRVDSEERELTIKELEKLNESQKEQWELAALGEWTVICHDDEDNEESTNIYLMKDELHKEQEVRQNLKSIICEFQGLQVIKDLQKMLTFAGCPREQVERALRQYARICHGPVPLTVAGQSKAEAVASLSMNLRRRTKRFVQDQPSCCFKEFVSVMKELDTLRDRQDSVEDYLKINLRKEEARRRKVQPSKRRRKTPRWAPSRKLFQWEIDMILMETYVFYEGKIKSSCRIDVLPIILE